MAGERGMWKHVRENATIQEPRKGMKVKIKRKIYRLPWVGQQNLWNLRDEGEGELLDPIMGNGETAFFVRHGDTGSIGAYWLDELEEIAPETV